MAPIIKQSDDGERELVMRSWGFILVRAGYAPKRVTNTRDDKVQTKFGKPIDAVRRLRRLQLESWQGHKAEQFIAGKLKNRRKSGLNESSWDAVGRVWRLSKPPPSTTRPRFHLDSAGS
jgi:hypothetical protein